MSESLPADRIQNEPGVPGGAPPPVPAGTPTGADGTPFDPERASGLIEKLRLQERNLKNNLRAFGLAPEAINRMMRTENTDDGPAAPPAPAENAGELKRLQLHAALIDGIHDAGMDRRLTLSVLNDKALAPLDPNSDTLEDDVADLLDEVAARHPLLKVRGIAPPMSGTPFPGGSGGGQTPA